MTARLRIAALAIGVVAGTLLVAPSTAGAAVSRTVVTPAAPLVGETVTITGANTRAAKKRVVLETWSTNRWVRVASAKADRRGRWTFSRRITVRQHLRVRAPSTKKVAQVRLLITPRADTATIAVQPGAVVVTHATPRAGRVVAVDARSPGGAWTQVARTSLSARTATRIPVTTPAQLTEYRGRLAPWRGAPGRTTTSARFANLVPTAPVALDLVTQDEAPIDSKETYVRGTLTVEGVAHPMRIRGRGNTTWENPKKPYRVKLDSTTSLLGMPAEKDWVLLANFNDRSLLRTHYALAFGRLTSMPWTPRERFVDVTLNGTPLGSYQLVEQVEVSADRAQPGDGGLLVEVDRRALGTDEPQLVTAEGIPLVFKDPSEPGASRTGFEADVAALESALFAPGGPDPAWRDLVDLDAAADWYLVQELFKNIDAAFYSSVFMTWKPGQFTMGPLWDFDVGAGLVFSWFPEVADPEGWWVRHGRDEDEGDHWFTMMLQDPVFSDRVAERWQVLSPLARSFTAQIPAAASALRASSDADWALWGDTPRTTWGALHGDSFDDETRFLQGWLTQRTAWMDAQLD